VAEGAAALGELTLEILVWDASEARVTEKAIVVERTLSASGFTVLRERQHSVDAWLESMPGTTCGQVRSVLLTSQNLVDLAPAMQVWSGVERCPHLGTPLAFATTNTSTPFGLSLYQQDVGDTLVLGPKGSGKSMLLSFLGASWRRYRGAQVRFIEKGQSARCMTLAQQGAWIPFGADGACLQPLAYIDEDTERAWCADWVGWVLGREMSRPLQPDEKGDIWTALTSLAGKPARLRTLSALQILLQHPALRAALTAYTLEGPHGGLLDGDVDPLPDNPWWCFELGGVPESALPVVLPVLMHVVERRLTGAPTLILVDEAWAVLENLETWMRTFRKKNAVLVLATQAVLDIANSPLAHVIQEQAPTRIFLPNSHALEEKTMKAYQAWGLTEPQCHQIATALPKQHYYISCPAGSRVVDFEFGPVALAFGGHSRQEELQAMREIEPGPGWAPAWLRQQGLAWAAEALETEEELCGNR
jgi:type IV secretion system protein VirB4